MTRVLIADDEPLFATTTAQFLESKGYSVTYREDGQHVAEDLNGGKIDLVIADLDMPGNRDLELLNHCRLNHPTVPFILVTGRPTLPSAIEGIRLGIHDYFLKPLDLDDLLHSLQRALPKAENKDPVGYDFEEILGTSPAVTQLKELAKRIAKSHATVLIRGESGTGKELLARAIHQRSRRRDGPFVTVDCTAIPEALMESAMFGHVKGAFTGAERDHDGLVKLADEGTLFLDEVGELPLLLQAKLLRVLQFGSFTPVGSSTPQKVNLRILAATHRDLRQEIQEGKFRLDLYYRLSVLEITSPPLRCRPEDIPLLARHFLQSIAARDGMPIRALTPEATELLTAHPWPGNIRELQNIMERCACMANGSVITAVDVQACWMPMDSTPAIDEEKLVDTSGGSLQQFREQREREYFSSLLQRHGGNVAKAAKEANLSRQGLHKALQRLGLSANRFRVK